MSLLFFLGLGLGDHVAVVDGVTGEDPVDLTIHQAGCGNVEHGDGAGGSAWLVCQSQLVVVWWCQGNVGHRLGWELGIGCRSRGSRGSRGGGSR